jgi:hypothetical protein
MDHTVINYLKYKIYGELINIVRADVVGKLTIIVFFSNQPVPVPQINPKTLHSPPHINILEIVIIGCGAQYRIVQNCEMQLDFQAQLALPTRQQRILF